MPSKVTQEVERVLAQPDYDYIAGPAQARMLQARLTELGGGFVGVDTETTGLDPRENQVRLVQLATRDYALLIDLDGWRRPGEREVPWDAPGLRELKAWLEGGAPKVLQNAAFDLGFLVGEGVALGGFLFDTMVAAKLINNGLGTKNDLGALVQRVLKVEMPKELQKSNWGVAELSGEQRTYAARDAICLVWLQEALQRALEESRVPAWRKEVTLADVFLLEMGVLRPIAMMQWHGFGFNAAGAAALRRVLEKKSDELKGAFLETLDAEVTRRDKGNALPREADGSFNTREKDSGSIRLGTKKLKGFNPRSTQQMAVKLQQAGIILPPTRRGSPAWIRTCWRF